ncbi:MULTISPECIES: phage major capsid protein [Methylobacterium]|uniref:Phage capsid-like C-terminal domain-containing protein n=3 Tax=Pseudomonadota TaxID=1224 RepID=A0ABQ4SXB4_9HYPH|nr:MULTISPECIES: phage major capsid protein [Methylobacterium]GBU17225.1 phage major capsid protein [Methylobacterium sp.]GJE07860.1 hypothetical protein AOPFMNJM_3192 [Methylobacterium jeotgali]
MKNLFLAAALALAALFAVSDAYAMGELLQAAGALPAAAPFLAIAGVGAATAMPRGILGATFRADASDPMAVLAQLQQAFNAFKAENETKLAAKAGKEDVVTNEKVDRINAAVGELQASLSELAIKIAAAAITGGGAPRPGDDAAYNTAFTAYARTGDGESAIKAQQFAGPRATLSVGSNPDGGLLAPVEWDRTITDKLKIVSAMRTLARVISISSTGFTKVYNDRATASGWVGETTARPGTGNAQFQQATFTTGELYAMPIASQQLLEDALIDIGAWLGDEVMTEMAYQEGLAFVNGDGIQKPKGLLQYASGTPHPWGAIPTVNSGAASALAADGLIDLVHDLPSERTPNAAFIMNRKTQGAIRKLKDGQGRYLWEPSTQVGDPATILGFPVAELAAMPDVAANALPIAFGDWQRGYLVVDRIGVQVLRDPYSQKPFVQFYSRKRVGGGVTDPTCLRLHKVAVNA